MNHRTKIILALFGLMLVSQLFSAHVSVAASWSNKPIHWGLKKSTDHQPPSAGQEWDRLLAKYDAFYLGDTSKREIYLTFDNGYENGYTARILDVLKEKQVPAAFFVTGHYLKDQPDLVKRMVEEGHIVGNHSWSHPDLTQVSDDRLIKELVRVEGEFMRITGVKGMSYLRPPRGIFSERTLALSQKLGYRNVFWSLAFVDWQIDRQRGWRYAYDNIMDQIHPGAVVLLHTVSRDNAEALPRVIDDLRAQGYEFKSLDDLVMDQLWWTSLHHAAP
ncbi:delta-lactam-biosynthetic de-N-acetylase [Caldalkalibacillus thermarum TA2.A1]|uniref:Delta-lactam-biosynthetic de-N-acetylase n=2 Tax=Caldalkalibacillus thermarum (strain TA2.A1) TaxID=986075 RepID=F5L421_CALTT|nr:delta-lactam-biosynthetic de-N-acetylase [Caldalkalibacillus thermarum TA2.A1]